MQCTPTKREVSLKDGLVTSRNIQMKEILGTIERIAPTDVNLVLVGEPGTGKEWLARAVHQASPRAGTPLWPVDCDSISAENIEKEIFGYESVSRDGITISRGAFEEAYAGTLLLNHMESLSPELQKKIGRTLEYRTVRRVGGEQLFSVDVRVIATLTQPSDELIRHGKLSKEMFFRISPIVIEIPPLRERREDIPTFIERFIVEMRSHHGSAACGITPEALAACMGHDWPGNVRNLRNAIEYACVMCSGDMIGLQDLPEYVVKNHAAKHSFAPKTS